MRMNWYPMCGVNTDESAIGIGFETIASPLAMVSWNSGVPVIVRPAAPTEISGKMPSSPVRKPSSKLQRISAPPETIDVCAMYPMLVPSSKPKGRPLRRLKL